MKPARLTAVSCVSRAVDLPCADLDDDVLALDEAAGKYYVFNETSSRIWALLEQPMLVSTLCDKLCQEFAVDENTCLADVLALLELLAQAKLLRVEG